MTDLRQAAEQALEALEEINKLSVGDKAICLPAEIDGAMEALRQALAQPVDGVNISQERVDETAKGEHEPVAWLSIDSIGERYLCFSKPTDNDKIQPLYTAQSKLKEKNT